MRRDCNLHPAVTGEGRPTETGRKTPGLRRWWGCGFPRPALQIRRRRRAPCWIQGRSATSAASTKPGGRKAAPTRKSEPGTFLVPSKGRKQIPKGRKSTKANPGTPYPVPSGEIRKEPGVDKWQTKLHLVALATPSADQLTNPFDSHFGLTLRKGT